MTTKFLLFLIVSILCSVVAFSQSGGNSESLEFRGFKIGDRVDTAQFKKSRNLYFPNYLDGWTEDNSNKLPKQYKGLPIAIWNLKRDTNIKLTLLKDRILKVMISNISMEERDQISKLLTTKFKIKGIPMSYKEEHPLQSYVTYWNLETWETKDLIVQIGGGDMRLREEPEPIQHTLNLDYTNLALERLIISDFKHGNNH